MIIIKTEKICDVDKVNAEDRITQVAGSPSQANSFLGGNPFRVEEDYSPLVQSVKDQ